MSKRRINKQQSARIKQKQKSYREIETSNNNLTEQGLVITRYGSHALVEDEQGKLIHCSIRPGIESLIAGDKVVWQAEGNDQGVVISCYPRETILGRPDKRGNLRPVAVNITQIMVVAAPKPEISWPLLDSYLVVAEHFHIQPCIVLNKTDLPCKELKEKLLTQYKPLGYPVLFTNFNDNKSYIELENQLNGQTSVFVGQSGVGKSSLISKILPHEKNIQTMAISSGTNLGRHTTSNSQLYHLPAGGRLIDSPGVREFGLWHMGTSEIARAYQEFKPYLERCKFRDCNHFNAPGCAIKEAVQQGLIERDRYENFVKLTQQFTK